MKRLFKEQKETLYKIQKDLGLSRNTLYKYVSKEIKVENMTAKLILDLANYFKIEANELYCKMKKYLS